MRTFKTHTIRHGLGVYGDTEAISRLGDLGIILLLEGPTLLFRLDAERGQAFEVRYLPQVEEEALSDPGHLVFAQAEPQGDFGYRKGRTTTKTQERPDRLRLLLGNAREILANQTLELLG